MSAYLINSIHVVSCLIISPQDQKKGIYCDGANHNSLKERTHYDSPHKCLTLSIFLPVKKLNKRLWLSFNRAKSPNKTLFCRDQGLISPIYEYLFTYTLKLQWNADWMTTEICMTVTVWSVPTQLLSSSSLDL